MCKVMMMAGINSGNREKAWAFIKEMAKELSPGNTDGLGYAAMSEGGDLFGERWHNNSEAFVARELPAIVSNFEQHLLSSYKGALKTKAAPVKYNKFGSLQPDSITAITLHTRMATSAKDFMNTHPFVVDNTSLIHNGVIRNASQLELKQSTCDSEAILNLYVKHRVFQKPDAIQTVANKLQGYYACGVFSSNKAQGRFLDVFKCEMASLNAAYVRDLDTIVFSTRVEDIRSVCGRLGFEVAHEFVFASDTLLRLDALTGEVLDRVEFESSVVAVPQKTKGRKDKTPKVSHYRDLRIAPESESMWSYQGGNWYRKGED